MVRCRVCPHARVAPDRAPSGGAADRDSARGNLVVGGRTLVEEAVMRPWLAGIFVLTVGALLLIAGADVPASALAENIVWST